MVNRRIGKNGRGVQKKKLKISKRLLESGGRDTVANHNEELNERPNNATKKSSKKAHAVSTKSKKNVSLAKQRSIVLKKQATERMVLKEHLRELKERRQRTRKGEDAKLERRELGKYIRQLEAEQKKSHEAEIGAINKELHKSARKEALAGYEGISGRDEVSENDLRDMFAHLVA